MEESLTLGDLVLRPEEFHAERSGKLIKLRKKEYQLLEFLALNKNKVMNRNTLLEYIWNYNIQTMTNTLEVHMSSLRRKVDGGYNNKMLQTVYGLGYKLCDATREQSDYANKQSCENNTNLPEGANKPVPTSNPPDISSPHPSEDLF